VTNPAAGGKAGGALVLIVDDFEDNRDMYASYLEFAGYRTAQAADGQEALDKAFKLKPAVIIMDLSLPGMDGWEATRRLKKDERTKSIPVVALTGHALAGHSKGAKDAGCDAFVTKPCLPEDLVREIKRILGEGTPSNEDKRKAR
jgi:CheY-like chemotaxis protein